MRGGLLLGSIGLCSFGWLCLYYDGTVEIDWTYHI
jgi:hypothetical protein